MKLDGWDHVSSGSGNAKPGMLLLTEHEFGFAERIRGPETGCATGEVLLESEIRLAATER